MKKVRWFIPAILFGLFGSGSVAFCETSIVRGPYLQGGTPTSMVICWRTNVPSEGRVRYGLSEHKVEFVVDESLGTPTADHSLTLSGLSPDTKYYYSIGTVQEVLAGQETGFFFKTSPASSQENSARVWVIGDSGYSNSHQRQVRDAYYRFTGSKPTDVWLLLGDNAYDEGTDAEYQTGFFEPYAKLLKQTVCWPTLGNHDGLTSNSDTQSGAYYQIFTLPTEGQAGGTPSHTEAYYSFDYGKIHFICLDSDGSSRSRSGPMLRWLRKDLGNSKSREWTIAFWHHAPYSKIPHDSNRGKSQEMREGALPILEAGGVDLVLSGHVHNYQRSFLIDGHYGQSDSFNGQMVKQREFWFQKEKIYTKPYGHKAHAGALYVIVGSSSRLVQAQGVSHPAMPISLDAHGSLVLDIDARRLTGTFLDELGQQKDRFMIVKN